MTQTARPMNHRMTSIEKRAVVALAGIFGLRMLGLFMLLPVLAIYAAQLAGSTPLLIGLALGIYGLTQGLLQIPFGMASDRFGRKRVITIGLLIFALGSVAAAVADSMSGLIIGRAIQGGGAISAAVLALTADLTREQQRTKAMAGIGISIGAVFLMSLMFAPLLQSIIGVAGIFWLSVGLALAAIGVLWRVVPNPAHAYVHAHAHAHAHAHDKLPPRKTTPIRFADILADGQLLRLNSGVFCLHMTLTALFVMLPAQLLTKSGMPLASHWMLYAPVLLLSVAGMIPLVMAGSRNRAGGGGVRLAFNGSVGLLLLATIVMAWAAGRGIAALLGALWLFFVAFNALEAMLPSLVSRIAPPNNKGAAIGVYNTFQFLGMFAGGIIAGWLSGSFTPASVYWFCAVAVGLWLVSAVTAPKFRLSNGDDDDNDDGQVVTLEQRSNTH